MVYTLVLEASAERIESSSLSLRTTFWGYSSSGRAVALQAIGGRFESCYLHQKENYENTKTSELCCLSFDEAWRQWFTSKKPQAAS